MEKKKGRIIAPYGTARLCNRRIARPVCTADYLYACPVDSQEGRPVLGAHPVRQDVLVREVVTEQARIFRVLFNNP